MRIVDITTELPAPAATVWRAAATPAAFVHVAAGMLRFPVAERAGSRWQPGDRLEGWTFLLGVVPFSRHRLEVVVVDPTSMTLESDEGGGLVRSWRHRIGVEALAEDRCRYRDRIEIDAGPLTAPVAAFARLFYRYRQRRWRSLAPVLAAVAD